MKKYKKLISLIVAMIIAFPSAVCSEGTVYTGIPSGQDIIKSAAFTDIKGNANTENIMKMAVYSIIRGYGNNIYRPNDNMTRGDMLAALVRATGRQDEAVKAGEKLKQQDPLMSPVDMYIRGHIEIAKSSGIIKTEEINALSTLTKAEKTAVEKEVAAIVKRNWKMTLAEKNKLLKNKLDQRASDKAFKAPVTRGEAAIWIARALGLQPIKGDKTMSIYKFKDWKSIKTADLPYVEAVLRKEIMSGTAPDMFSPKNPIRRGDAASILNAVANEALAALGFTVGYGRVIDVKTVSNNNPQLQTAVTDITIETPSLETINISIKRKTGTGGSSTEALPVIKNGTIGNETLIKKGDTVEYTLTNDNSALLLNAGSLKEIKGLFLSYNAASNIVQLKDTSGKRYYLTLQPDSAITARKVPVNINKVEPETPMTAIISGSRLKSIDLDISPEDINSEDKTVKILFADPVSKTIKVKDENGTQEYLRLSEDVRVYINDEPQSTEAIGFDQDALLKISDAEVAEVRIYSDIPEEEKVVRSYTGRVRGMSGNNIFVEVDGINGEQSYILYEGTPVIKDSRQTGRNSIKQGDRIKFQTELPEDNLITRLEIQSEGVYIDNIYKGEIRDIMGAAGEVILSDVYTYGHYDWVKKVDYMKFKLSDDIQIFNNGSPVDSKTLSQYEGKTVYAVSKKSYGSEELVHAVFKEGYEDTIYKKIDDIKWTENLLTLADGRRLNFREGDIVIKDGRLLDTKDLAKNTAAFIIQNKTMAGVSSTPVISLDSSSGFLKYRISRGYLHNMGEDYYTVENGYRLANNKWEKWGEFKYLLSDDTYIYDNAITQSVITADKFAESRFKPYTYTWPNYAVSGYGKEFHQDDIYHYDYKNYKYYSAYHEHCLLYTVTDEYGNTQAINIYRKDKESQNPDAVYRERMTAGLLESFDSGLNLITLKNARDYSPVYDAWQPIKASVPIDSKNAVILKDGRKIDITELKADDSIYVLSDGGNAIFIFVD